MVIAQEVQLEMLEQEVNWGDEIFQSWSHFLPSKGRRARDFIMAYVRRVFKEPDILERTEKIRAASGTFGTLPPPIRKEWGPYREPKGSGAKPWLRDELLRNFIEAAEAMHDNPNYLKGKCEGQKGSSGDTS